MPQKANFIVTGCISIHRGLMISPAVFLFLFQCWDRALDSLASSLELKIGFRFWPLALGCVCETARRPGFKSRRVILFRQNIPLSHRLGGFFLYQQQSTAKWMQSLIRNGTHKSSISIQIWHALKGVQLQLLNAEEAEKGLLLTAEHLKLP